MTVFVKTGKPVMAAAAVFPAVALASALALAVATTCMTAPTPASAQSLYSETSYRPLVADNKAFKAGDVLTVQVLESSSATSTADTTTRRKNGLAAELGHSGKVVAQTGIGVNGDFDGGGRTQRTNRLLATITVTVREVLPNNDLRVAGEQLVTINDEPQKVSLEGRVRPVDVSDGNIVLSTRLADSKIVYVGEGDVTQRSQRSWWRRFADAVGF